MKKVEDKMIIQLAERLARIGEIPIDVTKAEVQEILQVIENDEDIIINNENIEKTLQILCKKYVELLCKEDYITISFEEDPLDRIKFASELVQENFAMGDKDILLLISRFFKVKLTMLEETNDSNNG